MMSVCSRAGRPLLAQTGWLRPEPAGRVSVAQRAHPVRDRLVGAHRPAGHPGGAAGAEHVAASTRGEDAGEDGQPGVVVLAGERHQLVTTDHTGAE